MTVTSLLRETIIELLGTSVMDRDAIAQELTERGLVEGDVAAVLEDVSRLLQFDTSFSEVVDGVMYVPAVVKGTTWTVWVEAADAAQGFVRMHPQLSPLGWWLIGDDVDLVDESGAALGRVETDGILLDGADTDVVFGPEGWLDRFAGQWASVAVLDGSLCWTPCPTPPAVSVRQADALRAGFDRSARTEHVTLPGAGPAELRFAWGAGPVNEALVVDRAGFVAEPTAPLPELYQAAGLEERFGCVAAAGFDWDGLRSWQRQNRLRTMHGIDRDQADRLAIVLGACAGYTGGGSPGFGEPVSEMLAAILDDGQVASAFWDECARRGVSFADVGRFADTVTGQLGGTASSGLGWLRVRALDWSGNVAAAAELVERLATPDCQHAPLLLDAAAFASDRGDAITAYRRLRQAGAVDGPFSRAGDDGYDDDPDDVERLVREVEEFACHRPPAMARRNDPCPCGSGRKYKACHLGREQHSLDDRSAWLYDKAKRYLRERHGDVVEELADQMSAEAPELFRELLESPLVPDLALHEGGLFEKFLAARSALLPADEALLAARWAFVDRGVFEIQRVDADRLDLYDIGRGEEITVVNTHPSSSTRVGMLLMGRPLPVGDHYRAFSGFITVPGGAVADLLAAIDDGGLDHIAEYLGSMFRPPRMQNTDGEDLVLHTIRWRVPEPVAVDESLRAAGLHRNDDAEWRLGRRTSTSGTTVIASLKLVDDELVGEVNSVERAQMLRTLVPDVIEGAELIEESERSIDEVRADHDHGHRPISGLLSPDDPAARETLRVLIADAEARWLDESIPALGGRTPRDAVTDPIGRERLVHLLDSFPIPGDAGVGVMDPRRIRSALGL